MRDLKPPTVPPALGALVVSSVTDVNVLAAAKRLYVHGPDRVLVPVGDDYLGERPAVARARGITPEVVFIRRDGWMLGAQLKDAAAAFRTWADEWAAFCRIAPGPSPWEVRPISEWRP